MDAFGHGELLLMKELRIGPVHKLNMLRCKNLKNISYSIAAYKMSFLHKLLNELRVELNEA